VAIEVHFLSYAHAARLAMLSIRGRPIQMHRKR
jgi:hypothetical protein